MIKCVIFDLDDTLYNERTYVESAMHNVAEYLSDKFGLNNREIYGKLIKILDLEGRGHIFDVCIAEYGIDEKVSKLVQVYRDTKPQLKLYEDSSKLIQVLKDRHIKTAIITDGCSKVQHNKITALNLDKIIDEIVVTDDYEGAAKPSIVPYEMVLLRMHGIEADKCIYIGDNPTKDFIGAGKIGMQTARIIRNAGDYMKLQAEEGFEADITIHDLMEIADYL